MGTHILNSQRGWKSSEELGCFMSMATKAGMVDGEVLETLWAVLNGIADSIRSQSTAHRQEFLDDYMNDSNWKKMIQLSEHRCTNDLDAVFDQLTTHTIQSSDSARSSK